MDLAAELVRFNPDPALANWIAGTVQTLLDQAQKDAAEATRLAEQITRRDSELRFAQTKIHALTLELAHLRRMRFGVRSEALTVEQRDLFQETWVSDLAAAEAELAKQAALIGASLPLWVRWHSSTKINSSPTAGLGCDFSSLIKASKSSTSLWPNLCTSEQSKRGAACPSCAIKSCPLLVR